MEAWAEEAVTNCSQGILLAPFPRLPLPADSHSKDCTAQSGAVGYRLRLTWGLVRLASSGTPPHLDCTEADTFPRILENSGTHLSSTRTDLQILEALIEGMSLMEPLSGAELQRAKHI